MKDQGLGKHRDVHHFFDGQAKNQSLLVKMLALNVSKGHGINKISGQTRLVEIQMIASLV